MAPLVNKDLAENLIRLCKSISGSLPIIAACIYGSWVCGYADEETDVTVLLILDGYPLYLNSYLESLNGINTFVLIVNRRAFERDVEKGWLGEFVAEKITVPYKALINGEYLETQEVQVKRRIISELLDNLISEFPVLSREFLIETEYFLYENIRRRTRLFPLLTYSFLNMLRGDLGQNNLDLIMKGYMKAIRRLEMENKVFFYNGYLKISESHIDAVKSRKPLVPIFLRSLQRMVFLPILNILSKMSNCLMQDQRILLKFRHELEVGELGSRLEDPQDFILIPTTLGLVKLSEKSTIRDFVAKYFHAGKGSYMEITDLGGVLNDVYLIKFRSDQQEEKVVVKRFRDWSGFKWFALSLWSIGTKDFAVLGRSRLEREYALGQFLHNQGLPVPGILHVNLKERLIIKDYVDGEKMVEIIKEIISSKKEVSQVILVRETGRTIAEAHRLDVAIGDCKPENILVNKRGKIFFVDLEQALKGGDQAWDIAEFLFYSGHYVSPISSANSARLIAKNFVQGYLEAGGRKETVRRAMSTRYMKVFSVFTPPHVIYAISNICKRMGED